MIKARTNKPDIRNLFALVPAAWLLCLLSLRASGQTDSTLSPLQVFGQVARYHPLVRQADLFRDMARNEMQMARGGFDPKLRANFYRKSFDGKEYFNLFNPELKIPTLPGIELKAGYERNAGPLVNEESTTPGNGLQYLGASIPLVQGLLTDARRVGLNQARIGLTMADATRMYEINKILYSTAKAYWEWFFTSQQLQNAELAFRLAGERYRAVKQRSEVGDLAPIDSVEALIFLQDREIFLRQARVEEQNARLSLSQNLWEENDTPAEIPPGVTPFIPAAYLKPVPDSSLNRYQQFARDNHPEIQKLDLKTDWLGQERRLAAEMLKPGLNLHYNWLSRLDQSVWQPSTLNRNYTLGFDFSFPVLLRKERGKLGLVKTKLLQNNLETRQTIRSIGQEIQMVFNELRNLESLIRMQAAMVANYERLRNGEVRKFENGESSLFLINSREAKLIEALIKQASLLSKYQKERARLQYSAGRNGLLPEL